MQGLLANLIVGKFTEHGKPGERRGSEKSKEREMNELTHTQAPRFPRALAVAVPGPAILPPSAAGARGANYVALGDSYAAGPFIPNPVLPLGCLKSDHNYPHVAAPSIGLTLRDASCSGATTVDMTNPQSVSPDGPHPPTPHSPA